MVAVVIAQLKFIGGDEVHAHVGELLCAFGRVYGPHVDFQAQIMKHGHILGCHSGVDQVDVDVLCLDPVEAFLPFVSTEELSFHVGEITSDNFEAGFH